MKHFLTRVELYGSPSGADYTNLHNEMTARNFRKTVVGDNGKTYQLPSAEYASHSTTLDVDGVRDLAIAACRAVGYVPWPGTTGSKDCAVLTADWNRLSWNGLK
jgi:hypothetical protein